MSQLYPCKGCAERAMGCHANCAKYQEAKDGWDEVRDKRRADRQLESSIVEMNFVSMRHNKCVIYDRSRR